MKSALAEARTEISTIESKPGVVGQASGLQDAFSDMSSALRVVEGGDRAVPSQAITFTTIPASGSKARSQNGVSSKRLNFHGLIRNCPKQISLRSRSRKSNKESNF